MSRTCRMPAPGWVMGLGLRLAPLAALSMLAGCGPGAECGEGKPCLPGLVCFGGICMTKPAVLDVRASEATRNLEKMVGAVEAYAAKGGENGCPAAPGQRSGAIGPTPPLSVDCTVGPGARCIPGAGLDADGAYYPAELWRNDDIWREMEFEIEMGHYFHYSYQYDNTITGDCTFTAAAMADLDADGTFSDYSISCTASSEGTSCDEMKVERRFE